MSFLADRFQQLKDELKSGELFKPFTVADYFIDKSLIFARQTLKQDEFSLYSRLFDIISASLPGPDLIVYLYNNIPNLLVNIRKRGRTYEKDMKYDYLEKIQQGYFDYFRNKRSRRILILDTQHLDFVGSAADYNRITSTIFKEYPEGIHRITF
jgi:deoxyadenosine/deoxycytidine kinase